MLTVVPKASPKKESTQDWSEDTEFDRSLTDLEIRELHALSEQAIFRSRRHSVEVSHSILEREGSAVRTLNQELLSRGRSGLMGPAAKPRASMHAKKLLFAVRYSESVHLLLLGLLALVGFSSTAVSLGQPLLQSALAATKYILTTAGIGAGIFAIVFLFVQGAYQARSLHGKVFMFAASLLMMVEVCLFVYFVLGRFAEHG
jgi:hypothetical protein